MGSIHGIGERIYTDPIESSEKLHITTLKFTSFWEYIRAGDPVGVNILREGMALIDSGFFEPMQQLLIQGKMRPSPEAVWVYFSGWLSPVVFFWPVFLFQQFGY